jgi:phosphatidylglycerol:prolipoprotein diacylglycerol transferase
MHQILFHIPGTNIPIYGYGVMLMIGFLLALELGKFLARRVGLDPELFVNAGLIALVAGVLGARLSHVIENWDVYTNPARTFSANLFDAINIRSGGLTFYGGLILAFPACIAYGLWKKVPIKLGMDIIAPCVMVGLGIGRIGCFLNGCCYGAECSPNFPLAVRYPVGSNPYLDQLVQNKITIAAAQSLPVHPAQLYSTFTALLIAAILVCYFSLRPSPGRVMALMLILEGTTRFLLEILRAEPPVATIFGHGWSLSMILGVLLFFAGILLYLTTGGRRWPEQALAAPAPA